MALQLLPEYLAGNKEAKSFFCADFTISSERVKIVQAVSGKTTSKSVLEALTRQNPGRLSLIEKLSARGSVAVVTGQQLGLFGGPVFTLYKILTAVKLAALLEKESGIATVPIFWTQSEDHDFEEIQRADFLGEKEEVKALSLNLPREKLGGSVGRLVLGRDEIQDLQRSLSTLLAENKFENGTEILDLITRHYRVGNTLGRAFAGFYSEILKNFALLLFDPDDIEARTESKEFVATSFLRADAIERILEERIAKLQQAGFVVQVLIREHSPLFFVTLNGKRVRLEELTSGGYSAPGMTLTKENLYKLLDEKSDEFSSSALIRPLLQDRLFPTAAYVAGPTEFNYLAEVQPLYPFFNLSAPLVFPRASFTVFDHVAKRLLDKSGISSHSLNKSSVEIVAGKLRGSKLDPDQIFTRIEGEVQAALDSEQAVFAELGGDLLQALATTKTSIATNIQKFRGRYERALTQKEDVLSSQIERLKHIVYPAGKDQEKVLCVAHFLARYGMKFLDQVFENLDPLRFEKTDLVL